MRISGGLSAFKTFYKNLNSSTVILLVGLSAENSDDVGVNPLGSNSTLIIVVAVSLSVLVNIIITVGIVSVCRWVYLRITKLRMAGFFRF